jgi:hypothetical protein
VKLIIAFFIGSAVGGATNSPLFGIIPGLIVVFWF